MELIRIMDMMRMKMGRRYQIQFPDGHTVSGEVRKIDASSVILNSLLSSRVIQREDLKNSRIEEL
jgi:hypothetical protein